MGIAEEVWCFFAMIGAMTETELKIPISNTKLNIYGVLRGDYSKPLVILAPGLGGLMDDLLIFNASRFFEKQSISTLRVSFYGYDDDQRNIKDFDVRINAQDIDTIVDYVKDKGARWVGVVGHSYSGMAIVYSQKQLFDAAVLWDPSHTGGYDEPMAINNLENDFIYIKKLDSYVSGNGPGAVLSRKVFDNNAPGSTKMARKFKVPTLVANASDSEEMKAYGKDYADSIDAPSQQIVIPGSSHPFTEDGAMEFLYKETAAWIKMKLNTHGK